MGQILENQKVTKTTPESHTGQITAKHAPNIKNAAEKDILE